MENVLFLCTGNSCRSQMGEALLRHRAGDRFNAYSAGTQPKGIHPMTIQVLKEMGVDTSGLRSKDSSELMGKMTAHHVIIVCDNAERSCPRFFPGAQSREFWPLDDPPAFVGTDEERLDKFRDVRDEIDRRIEQWLATQ